MIFTIKPFTSDIKVKVIKRKSFLINQLLSQTKRQQVLSQNCSKTLITEGTKKQLRHKVSLRTFRVNENPLILVSSICTFAT